MSYLHLIGLSKIYNQAQESGVFSIREVHLNVREGEFFSLLGPSGCGKTTLLKLVAGLIQPDTGIVEVDGADVTSVPAEHRGFGMVFQQPLLFPHLTVMDNVAFGLKMQGIGKKERQERAKEMLAAVGLEGYDRRFPSELSGGQQQRVALARAIVIRPKLLLLDEPFSALDPGIRAEMRQLVKNMHQRFRMTMLFVTHDRDEAFELADRIAVMNEGEMVQTGTPMEVYRKPRSPFVARFIGTGNVIEGEVNNGSFRSGSFIFPLDDSYQGLQGPGHLVIRPESFRIASGHKEALVSGKVREVKFRQGFYQIQVDAGDTILEVMEKADGDACLQAGQSVSLELDASQVHFIPGTDELQVINIVNQEG